MISRSKVASITWKNPDAPRCTSICTNLANKLAGVVVPQQGTLTLPYRKICSTSSLHAPANFALTSAPAGFPATDFVAGAAAKGTEE